MASGKRNKPSAAPTAGAAKAEDDPQTEVFVQMIWGLYDESDKYTVCWLMNDLARIASDVLKDNPTDPQSQQVWRQFVETFHLIAHAFQSRLRDDLLQIASQAWQQAKPVLGEKEQVYAHGLLCAAFSTAVEHRDGMRNLEGWATSSVLPGEPAPQPLEISTESREKFFRQASGAIAGHHRMSAVLRAVAVASDARMVALLPLISAHRRCVVPPF